MKFSRTPVLKNTQLLKLFQSSFFSFEYFNPANIYLLKVKQYKY